MDSQSSSLRFETTPTKTIATKGITFAYRELGKNVGTPIVFLNHLGATLDNCDPRIMDGIAKQRYIVAFDNKGVGATDGTTPTTISEMAKDAITFIRAMGIKKADIIGFSTGAFVLQEILLQEPELVRKAVMTGTGPAGGKGIDKVTKITFYDMLRGYLTFRDPKFYLFFNQNEKSKKSARAFLKRLNERKNDRDKKISIKSFSNQLKAIHAWGLQKPQDLSVIKQPTLIANGDNDRMVPSSNTYDLAERVQNSELVIYKDAGHGGIFQYHDEFVTKALSFLS